MSSKRRRTRATDPIPIPDRSPRSRLESPRSRLDMVPIRISPRRPLGSIDAEVALLNTIQPETARMESEATRRILSEGRSVEKAVEVAEHAAALVDKIIGESFDYFPIPKPLACRQGCYFCCYLPVTTDIPTAIRIAEHMRAGLATDALSAARQRIADYCSAWSKVDSRRRFQSRLRCPLLVDGNCSVYPARPLSCRGWNSIDASECEEDRDHPDRMLTTPSYLPHRLVSRGADHGIIQGLERSGLDAHEVDLVPALAILFDVPDAVDRWLAGGDVFKTAWVPASDPGYREAIAEQDAVNRRANR